MKRISVAIFIAFLVTIPSWGQGSGILAPDSIEISLRQGESFSGNLTLSNTGTETFNFEANGVPTGGNVNQSLTEVLENVDAGAADLAALVPDRYDFSEGDFRRAIDDGGEDMYDGGNILATDRFDLIDYTGGVIENSDAFGAGGRDYFTKKYPALWVLVADLEDVREFSINGGLGADGSGEADGLVIDLKRGGKNFRGFVKRVHGHSKPSVNHLVIVESNTATHEFESNTDSDYHTINGLNDVSRIYYLLYSSYNGGLVDDMTSEAIMARFLETAGIAPSWLTVAPTAGQLAGSASRELQIDIDARKLQPGSYSAEVAVSTMPGELRSKVNLEVLPAVIGLSAESLAFGSVSGFSVAPQIVSINAGAGLEPQAWSASTNASWITLSTASGTTPSELEVSIDPANLAPGSYADVMTVTSGNAVFEIPVQFELAPIAMERMESDPDRPYIYALNQGATPEESPGFLIRINSETEAIERVLTISANPTDLAVSLDGQDMFVIHKASRMITRVDLDQFEIIETKNIPRQGDHENGTHYHIVAGDDDILFFTNAWWDPPLFSYDWNQGTVINQFYFGGVGDLEISDDGNTLNFWTQQGFEQEQFWQLVSLNIESGHLIETARSNEEARSLSIDSPLLLDNRGRVIAKDRVYEKADVRRSLFQTTADIYGATADGLLLFTQTHILNGLTGERVADLPVTSRVMAVSSDQSKLFLFAANELTVVDLVASVPAPEAVSTPTPGNEDEIALPLPPLQWSAVANALQYSIYFGSDRAAVATADSTSSLLIGQTTGTQFDSAVDLQAGATYYWRIDAEGFGSRAKGDVWSFKVPEISTTLAPDSFEVTLRSGESYSSALQITNNGDVPVHYSTLGVAVTRTGTDISLQTVKADLNENYSAIIELIPDRFEFQEGKTGESISDGGNDMYDGGNIITTSLNVESAIPYSDDTISTSQSFGPGDTGRYFTRKLDGLWVLAADLNGAEYFEILGNLGADGGGTADGHVINLRKGGRNFRGFVKRVHGHGKPSVNHLVIVESDTGTHSFESNTDFDQHRITGIENATRLYYLLYSTHHGTRIGDETNEEIMSTFLDVAGVSDLWLTVTDAEGTVAPDSNAESRFSIDALGLEPGFYGAELNVSSSDSVSVRKVPVNITVENPALQFSQSSFSVVGLKNVPLAPLELDISATSGAEPQNWTLTTQASWLNASVTSGTAPAKIILTPDTSDLSPAVLDTTILVRTDTARFEIPFRFGFAGLNPRKMVADPLRPYIYAISAGASEKSNGNLVRIQHLSGEIESVVPVGIAPSDLDLSIDGNHLYVIHFGDDTASKINLDSFEVVETKKLPIFNPKTDGADHYHIADGPGDLLYYTDADWQPALYVFNWETSELINSFYLEGVGDFEFSSDYKTLYTWTHQGWNNVQESRLLKSSLNENDIQVIQRSDDPIAIADLDTPLLLTEDGSRIFVKNSVFRSENIRIPELTFTADTYAITPGGELAFSQNWIRNGRKNDEIVRLSSDSTVKVVSNDLSRLFYFNAAEGLVDFEQFSNLLIPPDTAAAGTPAVDSEITLPFEGLSWQPANNALGYHVYFGSNETTVSAATTTSAVFSGSTIDTQLQPHTEFEPGRTYYWRVDSVGFPENVKGPVWSFRTPSVGTTIAPQQFELSLRSGESESGTVTLTNTSETPVNYTAIPSMSLQRGPPSADLEEVRETIDESYELITSLIPDRFEFSEGETGDQIGDGDFDMYDGGNYIATNRGEPVEYSNDSISTSNTFGAGNSGRYFTRKYPGLWMLAADLRNVETFQIFGGLGADGAGFADGAVLEIRRGGRTFRGFVKRVHSHGKPSVNHLIIAETESATHSFELNTDSDEHTVTGLSDVTRLYYLLYSSRDSRFLEDAVHEQIMVTFLEQIGIAPEWLNLADESGTVAPGASVEIPFAIDARGLRAQLYEAGILFETSDSILHRRVPITLNVLPPSLMIDVESIAITGLTGRPIEAIPIRVTAAEGLPPQSWTATTDASWLNLFPASGSTPTQMNAFVDASQLAAGVYESSIIFKIANASYEIPVRLDLAKLDIAAMVADPKAPYIYAVGQGATEETAGLFYRISSDTGSIEDIITISPNPTDLDINAEGDKVYVISHAEASISEIKLASLSITETKKLPPLETVPQATHMHIAVGLNGQIFFTDRGFYPSIHIYNWNDGALTGNFSIGTGDIAFDKSRTSLYIVTQETWDIQEFPSQVMKLRLFDGFIQGMEDVSLPVTRLGHDIQLIVSDDEQVIAANGRLYNGALNEISDIRSEIHALSSGGFLAFAEDRVVRLLTGDDAYTNTFTAGKIALSFDGSNAVFFDENTRGFKVIAISEIDNLDAPLPSSGSTIPLPAASLSFPQIHGANSYEIFLSNSQDGLNSSSLVTTTTQTAIRLNVPLSPWTTYYWRVDAITDSGRVAGNVWSFDTTVADQQLLTNEDLTFSEPNIGISVSADGDIMVTGAPGLSDGLFYRGGGVFAYRYDRNLGQWKVTQEITASDRSSDSAFGRVLALHRNRLVVGAPNVRDLQGRNRGAAYVFESDATGTRWQETQILDVNMRPDALFGESVALDGERVIVGAPADRGRINFSGAAYVFEKTEGGWVEVAKLFNPEGVEFERFGSTVAIEGNIAVVGAQESRTAYFFEHNPSTGEWNLDYSREISATQFIRSLSISNGLVAIGTMTNEFDSTPGRVSIFGRTGDQWLRQQVLIGPDATNAGSFGYAVSIKGDVLVVGANVFSEGASGRGFVYERQGNSWELVRELVSNLASDGFRSGSSVAYSNGYVFLGMPGYRPNFNADPVGAVEAYAYDLDLAANGAPVLTSAPVTEVDSGQPYSFQIEASDPEDEPVDVTILSNLPDWLSFTDQGILSGNPGIADAGLYPVRVMLEDASAARTVIDFIIHVYPTDAAPALLQHPRPTLTLEGREAKFTALATGGRPLAYQWTMNGSPISGANSDELIIDPVSLDDAGEYALIVSNAVGSVASDSVSLDVIDSASGSVVPVDFPTIQAALDAASDGDYILVEPGSYKENIRFERKNVTLLSTSGPEETVINVPGGTGVSIGPGGEINGFTITGGTASFGAGLEVFETGTRIIGNIFEKNFQGGGGFGAAIGSNGASPYIEGNIFRSNSCDSQHLSGVVAFVNDCSAVVVNNIFEENECRAITAVTSGGQNGPPIVANNTILSSDTGIRFISPDGILVNNIIAGNRVGLEWENTPNFTATNNVIFDNQTDFSGPAPTRIREQNISEDPLFTDAAVGDYSLAEGSPAIDTGTANNAPTHDFYGTRRRGRIDIGAIESLSSNSPPVFVSQPITSIAEDATYEMVVTSSDPDGETITISSTSLPSWLTLTDNGDNTARLTGSPLQEHVGDHSVTLTAIDLSGESAQLAFTLTVTPVNDAPQLVAAINDITVNEDSVVDPISLFDMFSDEDDADSTLTFEFTPVTAPELFLAEIDAATGNATFVLVANAHGTVEITARASDPAGLSVETTFNLTVLPVNDTPTVEQTIAQVSVNEDAVPTEISLFSVFEDIEDADSNLQLSVTEVTNPELFSSTAISSTTGILTLSLNANAFGESSLTVEATDSGGLAAQTSFNVNVSPVNDAPTSLGIATVTAAEDSAPVQVSLTGIFQDIEDQQDSLTFSIAPDSNTNPSLVTATITGSTATLTLAPDANGAAQISIVATDTGGLSVTDTLSLMVTPVADPPRSLPIPDLTADAKGSSQTVNLSSFFSDPDAGEVLTFSVAENSMPAILSGASITDNQLTLAFADYQSGTTELTVRATDSTGRTVDSPITVTLPELPHPQVEILGTLTLNRQTGLFEQKIRVTNIAERAIGGFSLALLTGPLDAFLYNGSGPLDSGNETVIHALPMQPGEAIEIVLEFYSPTRSANGAVTALATTTLPQAQNATGEEGAAIDRVLKLSDASLLVEFTATPGHSYSIQYSDDALNWNRSLVPVSAAGNRVQWIDQGPPRTTSHPSKSASRFYRVVELNP